VKQQGRISKPLLPMALGLLLPGCALFLHAQNPPQADETNLTAYQMALLNYKSGHFDVARTAIEAAEKPAPGDPATEILKARILTELGDFGAAKEALESLNGNPGLTRDLATERTLAFGDMCLRQHSYAEATKWYESLFGSNPNDPDLRLKAIYGRIGYGDLATAEKYFSQLKPLDSDNPSYYFAKAALAQATGKTEEAEQDIETTRTIYGITISNRYLKIYLQALPPAKNASTIPAATNAAPTGVHP